MTFCEPVASGRPYRVESVNGHAPSGIEDFLEASEFVAAAGSDRLHISGVGHAVPTGVRFHEKDVGPDGKDVRVWMISVADGAYRAESVAAH